MNLIKCIFGNYKFFRKYIFKGTWYCVRDYSVNPGGEFYWVQNIENWKGTYLFKKENNGEEELIEKWI